MTRTFSINVYARQQMLSSQEPDVTNHHRSTERNFLQTQVKIHLESRALQLFKSDMYTGGLPI